MALTIEQEGLFCTMTAEIAQERNKLNAWEQGFFSDQEKRYEEFKSKMTLTPKQWNVLKNLHEKATEV